MNLWSSLSSAPDTLPQCQTIVFAPKCADMRGVGLVLDLVLPIEVDNSFGLFVQLTDERSGMPVVEDVKEGGARVLPEGQGLSCPASGPPLKWIEENGITKGCGACKSTEVPVSHDFIAESVVKGTRSG